MDQLILEHFPKEDVEDFKTYCILSEVFLTPNFFDKSDKFLKSDLNFGDILEDGIYLKGKQEGIWIGFWGNGVVAHIHNYEGGILNGPFISYDNKGNIFRKGVFLNGKQIGKWDICDINGKLRHFTFTM